MPEMPNFCEIAMGAHVLSSAMEARAPGSGFGLIYNVKYHCYITAWGSVPDYAVFRCFRYNDTSALERWLLYFTLLQSSN